MAHKAEDERHDLAHNGDVRSEDEKKEVVDGVAFVTRVDVGLKVRTHHLDAVEESPKSQWHRQQQCGPQHDAAELRVKQFKVLLQLANQNDANNDEEDGQSREQHLC